MNRTVTTVLVTGATIAGVAGVLVLNPSPPSLGITPAADEQGTLPEGSTGLGEAPDTSGQAPGSALSDGRVPGTAPDLRGGVVRPGSPGRYRSGDDDDSTDEDDLASSESESESDETSPTVSSGGSSSSSGTTGSSAGAGSSSDSSGSSGSPGTSYTGSSYQSPWGAMQVSITVSNGQIVDIQWEQIPRSDGHSSRINSYAAPLLVDQALAAQSASVDGVSGATYTSEGFRTSLQSAIQKAGL